MTSQCISHIPISDAVPFDRYHITLSGVLSDNDVKEVMTNISAIYNRKKPFAILYDIVDMLGLPISRMKELATFMKEHEKLALEYMRYCVVATESYKARLLLHALFRLCPPVIHCPVLTRSEAISYMGGFINI